MKLIWLGHSCFKLISKEASLIFDPYAPNSVPGLKPLSETANLVLNSHQHDDHYCPDAVKITPCQNLPFTIDYIDTYHDDVKGAARGKNRIYIVSVEGMRIAHFGDLGCELTAEQMNKLKNLDVMLVPVGGFFTIDGTQAAQLVTTLKPRLTIPMHYRTLTAGYDKISTIELFVSAIGSVTKLNENSIEIDSQSPSGVIVLSAEGK